ncbi:MAG: FAD-binding oxidoreductase, partial [Sphingomonadaceae bacterium]|nr:FAD-binding oxidoreductase [Sphingomonadaceae bacterium]
MSIDVIVIGAGIAGASLTAELADDLDVLILEAEAQPGYHSTGRSAAFWTETYGGPAIQPLTTASYDLLAHPPADFADGPMLERTGAVHLADAATEAKLDAFAAQFAGTAVALEPLDRAALAGDLDVLILEAEAQPGYHSTGRSAAF